MARFVYEILTSVETPSGVPNWVNSHGVQLGPNLPLIINQLGAQGWELVCAADVARGNRVELFFKKQA